MRSDEADDLVERIKTAAEDSSIVDIAVITMSTEEQSPEVKTQKEPKPQISY